MELSALVNESEDISNDIIPSIRISSSSSSSTPFFRWMSEQIPILEELDYHETERKDNDCILDFLSSADYDICFRDTLKCLALTIAI
jgi:hypothetical protein